MYRRVSSGWLKHLDFILLDMLCLQFSFLLAYILRHGWHNPYGIPLYRYMAIFIEFADICVIFFFSTLKNVLKRGYYKEFSITVKHMVLVELLAMFYLFTIQEGQAYSRVTLYMMGLIYMVVTYGVRISWKKMLYKRMKQGGKRKLFIVTTSDIVHKVTESIRSNNYEMFDIAGIAIADRSMTGQTIDGIAVTADADTAAEYICREWIDEVFISFPDGENCPDDLFDKLLETGVTIHTKIAKVHDVRGRREIVERLGNYTVLTTTMNYVSTKQIVYKRLLDIFGGLVGCIFTLVLIIILGPIIFMKSPGPIFFSQIRVGRNGKRFKMYKFRSMYMDAEERKKELLEQNKLEDGLMFKMDFDPRVIGNRILPDGTKKTGLGDFIRRTSLDEFPQFFNVLKGDMSLVGTRPPTVDEWEQYELRHRARLATKPGITGMWQVNGRSNITDFEEVVKLDTEYINQWSIGQDIKILLKTVKVMVKGEGAM